MKKFTAITAANLFAIAVFSQIPNAGFENWTSKAQGLYDVPDQWGTMNNTTAKDSIFTVEKGNPGSLGLYYMRVISRAIGTGTTVVNGIAVSGKLDTVTMEPKSGFPYTGQPKSFTGKWQFMWMNYSPGLISATLTKWNASAKKRETIATAIDTLDGMEMSWVPFSIDFAYLSGNIPDSCIIVLKASGSDPGDGDYLFVDDLAFIGSAASIPDNSGFINSINLYPNPAAKSIIINFSIDKPESIKIQLIDRNGRKCKEVEMDFGGGLNKYILNTDGVAKGTYLLNLISNEMTETRKIMIE